jgi:hypothetical protein
MEASEIATLALTSATDFLTSLRRVTPAGFEAIDSAIDQIVRMTADDVSDEVQSTAASGLTIMLSHVPLD